MSKNEIEGLVLLLDVSESMSTKVNSKTSYLQACVDIIQMIIQRKMFQSSKDEIALILFGTPGTENELWDGSSDEYRHVTVARSFAIVDWELLDYVQNKISISNISGDILDGIAVAINHFTEDQNKKKIFKDKRIIVLTDFSSNSDEADKLKQISKELTKNSIRLDTISPFSEEDNRKNDDEPKNSRSNQDGNSKPMTRQQMDTIQILRNLCESTEGALFSFEETLTLLSTYQAKSIKSTGTKYQMTIGDKFTIPIISMIKCKENKPDIFKFKKVYAKDESVELKSDRARITKDDEQRDLDDKTDVVDAFKYGSTYVPIDSETVSLKLEVEKCFSLLGYTKSENIHRHYFLGDSVHQIVPDPAAGYEYEEVFVNMVRAMFEEDVYGIVRKVFNSRSSPELGCLIPYITKETICLFYQSLPFEDDLKKINLDNFMSMKKFKPNEKQLNLIDDLINSMDLSKKMDQDEEEELYDPHLTFNPYIQRMFQSIGLRATNPTSELPDFANHFTNSHIKKLGEKIHNEKTEDLLKRCREEFPIRELVKKAKKGEENIFDKVKKDENSDDALDVNEEENLNEILSSGTENNKIKKVGTVSPVNDFKILCEKLLLSMDSTEIQEEFEQICLQIQIIIKDLFEESLQQASSISDSDMSDMGVFTFQEKSFNCIKVLREYSVRLNSFESFNSFLKAFKIYLINESKKSKFNKYVENFWRKFFIETSLSLITNAECKLSDVDLEQSNEFVKSLNQNSDNALNNDVEISNKEDEEDLLDLM